MRVMPSSASLQTSYISQAVSHAKAAGKPKAEVIVQDQAVIDKVFETYGKDRVSVTQSNSRLLSIRV